VKVERATEATCDLAAALERLLPQLSPDRTPPTESELAELLASKTTALLVARSEQNEIVGTLALALFRTPTGIRAWIDDVVVDEAARGRGVGEALTREAIRLAGEAGANAVQLTTRPGREAANRLYQRLGFERRETNVYRYRF
jgi:ribosomal protein S18 acetylase RimI-like enzyme